MPQPEVTMIIQFLPAHLSQAPLGRATATRASISVPCPVGSKRWGAQGRLKGRPDPLEARLQPLCGSEPLGTLSVVRNAAGWVVA